MSISDFFKLIVSVITSWQVIAVLVALLMFVKLLNAICNYHKPTKLTKKQKLLLAKAQPDTVKTKPANTEDSEDDSDEEVV